MISINTDATQLNRDLFELIGALQGRGNNQGMSRLLRVEAGLLAFEVAKGLPPTSTETGRRRIKRDLAQSLTSFPNYEHFKGEQAESKTSGFKWLTATSDRLYGIYEVDNQRQANLSTALQLHYTTMKAGGRGKRFVEHGKRRMQQVVRINRTRIKKATKQQAIRHLVRKVGQLKASFARTAAIHASKKRIPAWVRKQIVVVTANGKSLLYDDRAYDPNQPVIEFGSAAVGVERNPVVKEAVRGAITRRSHILRQKAERILQGWVYEWNTGRVFKPTVPVDPEEVSS